LVGLRKTNNHFSGARLGHSHISTLGQASNEENANKHDLLAFVSTNTHTYGKKRFSTRNNQKKENETKKKANRYCKAKHTTDTLVDNESEETLQLLSPKLRNSKVNANHTKKTSFHSQNIPF
jgi:hypothetical protein